MKSSQNGWPPAAETDQLHVLTRNFFARFFESELLSPQMDFRGTLSQALGVLASPGFFVPLLLLPVLTMDGAAARSWNIKLIFIFFAVFVMGLLAVIEWDALMLEPRDRMVLMPLPVRPRAMFAAKFTALAVFMIIFAVDVNVGSILLLPPLEAAGKTAGLMDLARYAYAYTISTIAASAFIFLFFVSLEGLLINVLPPKWFRRVSTFVQVTAILTFLAALFFFPAIFDQMPQWRLENSSFARFFPPMWYVGLCEQLQGTADARFQTLARNGIDALIFVGLTAVCGYVAAYGRFTRQSLQGDVHFPRRHSLKSLSNYFMSRVASTFVPQPVERAIFDFSMKTLLRNSKHRLIMAVYVGTALALVLEEIVTLAIQHNASWEQAEEIAILSLPLVISFFLLSGIRFAFNVPSELDANWVFQLSERQLKSAYVSAVQKCMVICVIAPVAIATMAVYGFMAGFQRAGAHALYCSLLSLVFVELLLWRLDRVPFTCSYAPGKIPVVALLSGYCVAFTLYTHAMAALEYVILQSRLGMAVSLFLLAVGWRVFRAFRNSAVTGKSRLVFDDVPDPVVRTLNLAGYNG